MDGISANDLLQASAFSKGLMGSVLKIYLLKKSLICL